MISIQQNLLKSMSKSCCKTSLRCDFFLLLFLELKTQTNQLCNKHVIRITDRRPYVQKDFEVEFSVWGKTEMCMDFWFISKTNSFFRACNFCVFSTLENFNLRYHKHFFFFFPPLKIASKKVF